ncbi:MAG: hypothetical protein V9G04_12620 [Nocardioides sp.]|jgi:outer membrane protein assembly factor BamB
MAVIFPVVGGAPSDNLPHVQRVAVVFGVVLLTWLFGPLVLVLALIAAIHPGVRRFLRPHRPLRTLGIAAGVGAVLLGLVVLIPDGWLPIPPGAGVLVGPDYVGRPATAQPIEGPDPTQNPHLAPNGRNSMHNDAAASDAYEWGGPLGRDPQVDTAWYGLEECATLAFDSRDRIIGLCGDLRGPTMHVIDPDSMRFDATLKLPKRPESDDGKKPWENLCAGAYFYLDNQDRAVTATTDRRILAIDTADGEGNPDLTIARSWSLRDVVPKSDCPIALMPGWDGLIWWLTQDGLVGTLDPATGKTRSLDLQAPIDNSFAVGNDGAAYVVTTHALYRLEAGADGTPEVRWRKAYDRGSATKPGQLGQGSGTTPTILTNGWIAITDNAEPRMNVVAYDAITGAQKCSVPVFEAGASATENSLIGVGTSVIVENNYGYTGPGRVLLGRSTSPGVARVDLTTCRVAWTADVAAPTSVPKASLANGLAYVYAKRRTWTGVSAWYLTALDLRTGRVAWGVRTGTGSMFNNHYAAIYLSPDGAAYVATLAGLIRVRDGGS